MKTSKRIGQVGWLLVAWYAGALAGFFATGCTLAEDLSGLQGGEVQQDAGQDVQPEAAPAPPLECPYHCPNRDCYELYQRLCAEAGLPTE